MEPIKTMKIEDTDFRFIDEMDWFDTTPIEILTGPYSGVKYHYGKVEILGEETIEMGQLSFEFALVQVDKEKADALRADPGFHTEVGDILYSLLVTEADIMYSNTTPIMINAGEIETIDESGTIDIEESDNE